MIIQELRAEFNDYFRSGDAELILWLDPQVQWGGVVDHLTEEFEIIQYHGSQLEVKSEVELRWAKGERSRFILYLPGLTHEDLSVLNEYEYSGKVFEETLLQAFRRWGLDFEREHEIELEKILPLLATKFATRSRSFWREKLTPENVRRLLFDDDDVRKMLATPVVTAKELKEEGSWEIFCDYVKEELGGPSPEEYPPLEWAKHFTVYLILTEIRVQSGRPESFPVFEIAWADDCHEKRALSFLRDWLRNDTYKEDFKRLSIEVEKVYDLSPWAGGLWAQIDLIYGYDEEQKGRVKSPFIVHDIHPIQIATFKMDEFCEARERFSAEEWLDLEKMPKEVITTLKTYCESGMFARGRENLQGRASIAMFGNTNQPVEVMVKTSHLFAPMPSLVRNDMAFLDRLHFYLPGWEMPKMEDRFLTMHYGFVVDYLAEAFKELRKRNYTEIVDRHFRFGSHLNTRDVKAVRKTVSGFIKLMNPTGKIEPEDLEVYLEIALEGRRRVKEQLKKLGAYEYYKTSFSYIDESTDTEKFVTVPEIGGSHLISPDPLPA